MRRQWLWGLLAISIAGFALMFALVFPGGPGAPRSSAHTGTGTPHLEIDLVKDGSTWCNPVDTTFSRPVNAAVTYEIALCLSDATSSPAGFNLDLIYDDTLNSCPDLAPTDGTNLDDNPDANAGNTAFTTPNLGTGFPWDCNYGDVDPPVCDKDPLTGPGKGRAYMQCGCTSLGCATLAVGAGTSKPIAVVTMKAIAAGVDSISLDSVSIINEDGIEFVSCYSGGPCVGATDTKLGPATATFTPTPTETSTPAPPTITPTPVPPTETPTPLPTPTFTPLPTPYADIDKIDNGDGWCDPVDDESTEVVGDSHSLAVCAHNMPNNIAGFDLHITYDNGLDDCDEIVCTTGTCVDDNPDLADALGDGWDCNTSGQPVCDTDSEAYIHCSGPGSIKSGPLAILNLDVIDHGTDNVAIHSLVVYNAAGVMAECGVADGGFPMDCLPATDTKVEPSPTPTITNTPPPTATPTITQTPSSTIRHRTATPKPTATEEPTVPPPTNTPAPPPATPTPLGGVGTQLVPPETGSGSTGVAFSWLLALLAGTAGIAALAGGGFYLRFARRRVT